MSEGEHLRGGREFAVRGCSATRGEEKECLPVGDSRFFLFIQKSTMGGVCVEAWTDSPATPLQKQLTAITSLSYEQKLLTEGGWNKTKEDDTWVFFSHWPRFDKFPHILILVKIMPLSI